MKIISLNIWGGRAGQELLLDFFKKHAEDIDVFCLQEVWSAPYDDQEGVSAGGRKIKQAEVMVYGLQEISKVLPNHQPVFHPHFLDNYGLMMLVRKDLDIFESGDVFVYKHKGYVPEGDIGEHARNIQYVSMQCNQGPVTVINFHGLWTNKEEGKGKKDTPERLEQSDNILNFISNIKNPIALCGDFNLLPDTESLKKLERAGLKNLIKEYGITSTRTSFYQKPEKFADYVFVSDSITVKEFKVLPDEVSDHSPLYLEFT